MTTSSGGSSPLRRLLRRRDLLYAGVGIALGGALTLGGYVVDYVSIYGSWPHRLDGGIIRGLHVVTPVHYFTDLFPMILGLVGGLMGHLHDRLRYYSGHLEDLVDERTEALRLSEERYSLAARAAHDGLWDWDLTTDRIYYSPRWHSALGEPPEAREGHMNDWMERIHPEDLPRFRARIQSVLNGNASQFVLEYRIRHADGSYRWMQATGMTAKADGAPRRLAGSQTDIHRRRLMETQLMDLALYDPLTGLANRTLFLERVGRAFEGANRQGARVSLAVVFLDLDQFKRVNDSLGHFEGDLLLKSAATRMKDHLGRFFESRASDRQADGEDGHRELVTWTLARTGGDEFGLLLENLATPGLVEQAVLELQGVFQHAFDGNDREIFVTASAGIVLGPAGAEGPDDLLRDADTALNSAKAAGSSQRALFDPSMRSSVRMQLQTHSDLHRALQHEELFLTYQPVVDLRSGALRGFEALLRWDHPERGVISPGEFIELAEEAGVIVEIGRWALQQACGQLALWSRQVPEARHLTLSVNVSRRQLIEPTLVADVLSALAQSGLDPARLHLELTESLLLQRPEESAAVLNRLREAGMKIAIDDFGTGHSSLYAIQSLPADILKIDRSFITPLDAMAASQRIAATIIALARALRMTVVAEGIETEEQRLELEKLGCTLAQGYLFARPCRVSEIERTWLAGLASGAAGGLGPSSTGRKQTRA